MLPDMRGLRVVDLGCGFGWFCRWAREAGASRVLGMDLSEKMLSLPDAGFDVAFSSLAFHYVEDAARLYRTVHHALAAGGRLVFSTEHPVYMAPTRPGWLVTEDGRKTWPVDRYLVEGPRTTDWLSPGVVKHHRTIGTTLSLLRDAGFSIDRVQEFCPTPEQIAAEPALAEEVERPMFLLVSAQA
jgi:SAM-dependent methyltransferase